MLPAGTVEDSMLGWDVATESWVEQTSLTYDEPARMLRVAWTNLSGAPSGYEVTRNHGSGEVKRAFFGLAANEDSAMLQYDTAGNLQASWVYDFSLDRWECSAGGSITNTVRVANREVYTDGRILHKGLQNTTLPMGDTNNLAQPNTALYLWRLTPNAGGSAVTGIAAIPLAAGDGQQVILANIDTAVSITLKHEDAGSSADNRLRCPNGVDLVMAPDESRMLIYDGTSNRWRVLGAVA